MPIRGESKQDQVISVNLGKYAVDYFLLNLFLLNPLGSCCSILSPSNPSKSFSLSLQFEKLSFNPVENCCSILLKTAVQFIRKLLFNPLDIGC